MYHDSGSMAQHWDDELVVAGRRLKAARNAKHLKLQEVADAVDLTHQHVSKIERGLANPSLKTLARLAHLLGLSLQDLFVDQPGGGRGYGRLPMTTLLVPLSPEQAAQLQRGSSVLILPNAAAGEPEAAFDPPASGTDPADSPHALLAAIA